MNAAYQSISGFGCTYNSRDITFTKWEPMKSSVLDGNQGGRESITADWREGNAMQIGQIPFLIEVHASILYDWQTLLI